MATAFKLISSYKTTGTEANLTLGSIPATYTDLLIVYNGRASVVSVLVANTYNNDVSSSSYFNRMLQANPYFGATPYGMAVTNSGSSFNTYQSYSSMSSNVYGGGQVYIPGYRAAQPKSPIHDTGHSSAANGSPANDNWIEIGGALYNTNTAISSIKLVPDSASFLINSTIYLYGITNA